MARSLVPSQQKLAERLTILNDRGIGMLTRIYNIKRACSDVKSKPAFLSDKSLESVIKQIVRKFPTVDKSNLQNAPLQSIKTDVVKALSLYYFTFVDLLEFKDHVGELLTTMDACQVQLNINLNYDLTKSYLDLIVTYVSLMILLSRVDDRKAVLGLFNHAHEMTHGSSEQSFPRLGQMIVDFETPLRKLVEEFCTHTKLVLDALTSLKEIFPRRNLTAEDWRNAQLLSLVANSLQILTPALSETPGLEYLSLDSIERWIVICSMVCPGVLNNEISELNRMALSAGYITTLFRDEVIYTHMFLQQYYETVKGATKQLQDIKNCFNAAVTSSILVHRERRKFLRSALKELALILSDQPGLLGPKALFVFMGLSFARDEVLWLLRHHENPPPKATKQTKAGIMEDFSDRQLPELLFHMEELRALVRKYAQVVQRYYVQYLSGFDAIELNNMIQNIPNSPEDESVLLSSFYNTVNALSVKQVESNQVFDLRGFRLDWFRLQAYTSVNKAPMPLRENDRLARTMNTIIFHTKMVDYLDQMLFETSDLSIFCFYPFLLERQFHLCLEYPSQVRFAIAFPMICAHFIECTHTLCPEEHIGDRSLTVVNGFLDEMAKEAKNIITNICAEHCVLYDQLLPKNCSALITQNNGKKRRDKKGKQTTHDQERPGLESVRKSREEFTKLDKLHMALTELCYAINYCSTIIVWEHTFAPREYLFLHLEKRFNKAVVGMIMYDPNTQAVAKPSELLSSVRAYMSVLQSIENYAHIDITRVFNSVLLGQTQAKDGNGQETVTSIYKNWYIELLKRATTGNIVYSPKQKAFVTVIPDNQMPFTAEEFTDVRELQALAELIGPYGVKDFLEDLMQHVARQVEELKKVVAENEATLQALRTNYDKPDQMKELYRRLNPQHVDIVLKRMTLIGVILCFRNCLLDALNDVLDRRVSFLMTSIRDIKNTVPQDPHLVINELATAAGISCNVDPNLCQALKSDKPEQEYSFACLLMVFIAVSIPKLARNENSNFRPHLQAHANNVHCLPTAINALAAAMFTVHGHGDVHSRMEEFLALTSSSLLRLGQESEKDFIRNRDAVYILLDLLVEESQFLTMDQLETCFPYALIRNSYHAVFRQAETS